MPEDASRLSPSAAEAGVVDVVDCGVTPGMSNEEYTHAARVVEVRPVDLTCALLKCAWRLPEDAVVMGWRADLIRDRAGRVGPRSGFRGD